MWLNQTGRFGDDGSPRVVMPTLATAAVAALSATLMHLSLSVRPGSFVLMHSASTLCVPLFFFSFLKMIRRLFLPPLRLLLLSSRVELKSKGVAKQVSRNAGRNLQMAAVVSFARFVPVAVHHARCVDGRNKYRAAELPTRTLSNLLSGDVEISNHPLK